jgi:LysR family transcriptional regulator, hydrogen peroxide-inducible genes activator
MEALSTIFAELANAFPKMEIRMSRNPPHEIGGNLKSGEAEVAISGPLEAEWDRLETRKLYEQKFGLLLSKYHRLSTRNSVEIEDLNGERLLSRAYCPLSDRIIAMLKEIGAQDVSRPEVPSVDDRPDLVRSSFGVGIWPVSRRLNGSFLISQIQGMDMSRWMHVHTVFGRRVSLAHGHRPTGCSIAVALVSGRSVRHAKWVCRGSDVTVHSLHCKLTCSHAAVCAS